MPAASSSDGVRGASPEPALFELVAQALEALEREGPPGLQALCAAHPDQASALRARVEQLRALGFIGAPPRDAALPERLGGFRILGRLGAGGMGVVLLAEQEGLGRRVALKLVRPDLLFFDGARKRFRREVEAVARLAHPGIVPVYAGGEDNGVPWCAMEYVRGASLDEVLAALGGRDPSRLSGADLQTAVKAVTRQREALLAQAAPRASSASGSSAAATTLFAGAWVATCLRVARSVAEALDHAHAQGVLHRDVKPSNIMLTPEGRVLLLDFGLATASGSERLTGSGAPVGSLAWMSPEQVRGRNAELDARTDVYSLGATLYELLTLRSPFAGGDLEEVRARVLEGRAIPLRDLNPSVPRDVETVCQRAMDAERERRYPDVAALAQDLGNALELRPVLARRPGALLKARRWAQRNPARAVAGALAVLLLVGGPLGYGVLQSRAADEQRRLNDQLERSRGDLQLSLAAETRQREASERGYQRTLAAIDQFLQTVGSEDLADLPGFTDTRVVLLERALAFYRELEAEQPGDSVPRKEQARTRKAIGDILVELGRPDEALAIWGELAVTLRELRAAQPEDPDPAWLLAGALTQSGVVQQEAGRLDDARRDLDEAAALYETLAARPDVRPDWLRDQAVNAFDRARLADDTGRDEEEHALYLAAAGIAGRLLELEPDSVGYAVDRAGALRGAATSGVVLGRAEESERLLRDSWASLHRLHATHPRERGLRREIVETGNNLGLLLLSRPDRAEALEVLTEAFEAARSLAEDFPHEPLARRNAAALGLNVAAELGNQKRHAEAAPVIEASCVLLAELVEQQPESVEHPFYLGAALSVASGMHLELGDSGRALREADEAVANLRLTQAALQGSGQVANQLASALFQLADVHRALQDRVRALAVCEEAFALGGGRPDILFQGAEIAGHLATDARAAGEADAPVAARAEAICLVLLQEAVDKGFSDALRLRDAVFGSLQGRQDFEDIVGRIGPAP